MSASVHVMVLLLHTNHLSLFRQVPTLPFNVSCQRDAGDVSGGIMRGTYRYTRLREVMALWHTGHTSTRAAQLPQNTCLQRVNTPQ